MTAARGNRTSYLRPRGRYRRAARAHEHKTSQYNIVECDKINTCARNDIIPGTHESSPRQNISGEHHGGVTMTTAARDCRDSRILCRKRWKPLLGEVWAGTK